MDWLEWAMRIAVVFGMSVFIICAVIGAQSLITAWRISLELWQAKRRYYALRAQTSSFRSHVEEESK
jgi:hypothetical protein